MSQTTDLELRNLKFELGTATPRYWHGGRRAVTMLFNNLSIFFPLGERFFIASVRAHRDRITCPRLLADIRVFCAQEGIHGREHGRYNEMLAAQGLPAAAMEGRIDRLLRRVARLPPLWRLAAACALEHFTALLAELLLRDPQFLAGAEPVMAGLWKWHAAEETEHKSVAFDVYQQAGGGALLRILIMVAATLIFWGKVAEQQVRLMHADGILGSAREWAALLKFCLSEPGWLARLVRPYLAYYRPGFHPTDLDTQALLAAWKRELHSAPVYQEAQ